MATWVNKEVLIVVRTYPAPSAKDIEVSCTAGLTLNGEWIRLFPVRYRHLAKDCQFHKYDWISVRLKRASDHRSESYNPDPDSIKIVSHMRSARNWAERKRFIYRAKSESLCWLQRQLDDRPATAATLGLFKPARIKRLTIEPEDNPNWTADEVSKLRQVEQEQMFGAPIRVPELEKIPFKFIYSFDCSDPECGGHSLSCTDWEMNETYRSFRERYGAEGWQQHFRVNFERNMIDKKDTHFYVGTVHRWPKSWIIVGLFYPPQ